MATADFADLFKRKTRFGCIAADYPWPENGGGKIKRGADRHYETMKPKEILASAPALSKLALPDAHLWLWVTNNYLPLGLAMMEACGFRYVSCRSWFKAEVVLTAEEREDADEQTRVVVPKRSMIITPERMGLGQYLRGRTELLLFGVRGKPGYRTLKNGKRAQGTTDIIAPTGRHSEKPPEPYEVAQRVSPGPYLELFGLQKRDGWTVWGDGVWTK